MVSITIQSETVKELLKELEKFFGGPATLPAGEEANVKPAKKLVEDKPSKIEKAAKEEAPTIKSAATPFAEVSEAISTLVSKAGKPATVKLLGEFQVKRGSELQAEQYAPFLTAAKKLLAV